MANACGQAASKKARLSTKAAKTTSRILVLDNDDTMFRNDWALATELTTNINAYCKQHYGLPAGTAYKMYKKHGTTLKALLAEGLLTDNQIKSYLEEVHTFENLHELIKPDPKLRTLLEAVQVETFVFTAGPRAHAERCFKALGVHDLLVHEKRPIIDAEVCKYITKYEDKAFQICSETMSEFLGFEVDPKDIIFVDDNLKNIRCAKRNGWGTCVLMGEVGRDGQKRTDPAVDHTIEHLCELRDLFPSIFERPAKQAS